MVRVEGFEPRPSAPKLDDQRILKDLAGAIGALSNAKERVETPTVGLKWGCRILVDQTSIEGAL